MAVERRFKLIGAPSGSSGGNTYNITQSAIGDGAAFAASLMDSPEDGPPGPPGNPGAPGANGATGSPGATGPAVFLEAEAIEGDTGSPGPAGSAGAAGSTGSQGPAGPAVYLDGDIGETGDMGPPGPPGPQGPAGTGSTGAQGPMGPAIFLDAEPGEEGWPGPPGAKGDTGATGGGGGGGIKGSGTALLDFGAFPGASDASVAVTGLTTIVAGSSIVVQVSPTATSDHSADEHWIEPIEVFCGNIVVGTGFTIYGINTNTLTEPLAVPGVSTFRPAATSVYGYAVPSIGGQGTRLYGKFTVSWMVN